MIGRRPVSGRGGMVVAVALAALLATLAFATAASGATSSPHWYLEAQTAPTSLPLAGEGAITVTAANIGDAPSAGEKAHPTVLTDKLPAGMEVVPGPNAIRDGFPLGGAGRFTNEEAISGPKEEFKCAITSLSVVTCTFQNTLQPFEQLQFLLRVKTSYPPPPAPAPKPTNEVTLQEGGTAPVTDTPPLEQPLHVNNEATHYGIESGNYELTPETEDFEEATESGSHPFQLTTTVNFNQVLASNGPGKALLPTAPALSKNLHFKLPPGLVGRATAVEPCTDAEFGVDEENSRNTCPEKSVVGVAAVSLNAVSDPNLEFGEKIVPVFNLVPGPGEPARFGFEILHVPVILNTSVRTGEDYGATVSVENAPASVQLLSSRVTIWGTPGDPRHDSARGWPCLGDGSLVSGIKPKPPVCGEHEEHNEKAFLTLPTSCEEQSSSVEGEAYGGALLPAGIKSAFSLSGCQELPFEPSIEVKADEHTASTPSGLTVEVSVPQGGTLTEHGKAEADIKSTTLALPTELEASAGAANNLETCEKKQAGFIEDGSALGAELERQQFSFSPPTEREHGAELKCPDAAKVGTVEIETPFLEHRVTGSVYLANQDTNPFASPLVLYLIAEEPESKVLVKLAGEVKVEPTGQLVSRFNKSPEVAFEHLKLHLFNGSGGAETAAQATPARCGSYSASTTALFETWSKEPGEPLVRHPEPKPEAGEPEGLAITSGPHGTPCTQAGEKLPFAPSFQAGSTNPEAGKYSPFTLTIARPDGSQALKSIAMQLPPGLAAKLASVTPCGEPAAAQGTCGEESKIGESTTYSGLGNAPVDLPGTVYLTGPYDGAPFGLSTVTNAEHVGTVGAHLGPFNIGTIVVRSTININETTAAASIDTEKTTVYRSNGHVEQYAALPEFIEGLPAQIKALSVAVNRAEFEFNPTNCTPMAITGTLAGSEGTNEGVSESFTTTNCAGLGFAPKLTASVVGQGSKLEGTTFSVKIESPGLGQANIHKVDLTIPSKLPSRLTTIQKACLEAVFNANPASCDEGSVIGEGVVHTPVFKNPLRGPAYLVSHGGAAFPDVEFVLQGEGVKVVLDGKTYIHEGVTYSKFETSPDAPFSTFETTFPAGPHSALTPSVPESENFNLCKQTLTIPTEITGQNGAFISQTTPVAITGCKGVKPFKVTKAELLAKALKACRSKYKGKAKKAKLQKCEKAARKKYGTPHKASSKKKSSKKKK